MSCIHSVVLLPPDAVAGLQSSRVLGFGQDCVGFDNHSPISPPCIADGVAGLACAKEAEDTPVRGTMGTAHHQLATERVSQYCETIPVVLETTSTGG